MATETDKIKTGALGTLVAVGLFATLSIALAVTALVRYSTREVSDQRQDLAGQQYRDLRSEQTGKLGAAPTWTDKGTGKVSVPIERAKAKVVAELNKDPASATPPAPTPAPTADGSAAGVVTGENAPAGTEGAKPAGAAPASSAAAPVAPAPTHATVEKKPAPAGTVAVAKPPAPAPAAPKPAAPTTAAVAAPAPAPAAPKPTDG